MKTLLAAVTAVALWTTPQIFKVNVDAVRVDVLVTDGRNPVAGLTANAFELRDSGVVQQIESVSFEDVTLCVMLAFDTSNSLAGPPLEHLKDAATALVDLLGPSDRAALLTFSGALRRHTAWTSDHAALRKGIAEAQASGATTLHDAAYAALTLRDTTPGRRLVLLFSDGADTASWLPGGRVLEIAKRNDAVVYVVSLTGPHLRDKSVDGWVVRNPPVPGHRLDFRSGIQDTVAPANAEALLEPFIDALAAETGGKVLNAERSDQLRDAFLQIVKEFRSRYLITYTPKGVDAHGWHPIEVKVKGRSVTVRARRGYSR